MDRATLEDGLVGGAVASILSGAPSTLHALVSGTDLWESSRAAGSLVLSEDHAPATMAGAGLVAHVGLSLAWGVVLSEVLPRRAPIAWGAVAGAAIAALDLGMATKRWPRIRALPQAPQVADHVAYGLVVAVVVAGRRRDRDV